MGFGKVLTMFMSPCLCNLSCIKHANKVTRSGPELRRRPSRGTNINPFTPVELQRKSKSTRTLSNGLCSDGVRGGGDAGYAQGPFVSTPVFDKEFAKPHKVGVVLSVSNIFYNGECLHLCSLTYKPWLAGW